MLTFSEVNAEMLNLGIELLDESILKEIEQVLGIPASEIRFVRNTHPMFRHSFNVVDKRDAQGSVGEPEACTAPDFDGPTLEDSYEALARVIAERDATIRKLEAKVDELNEAGRNLSADYIAEVTAHQACHKQTQSELASIRATGFAEGVAVCTYGTSITKLDEHAQKHLIKHAAHYVAGNPVTF